MTDLSSAERQSYELPKIAPPSLEDLRVRVPAPVPPDSEQLIERLYARLRKLSPRRERARGEAIEPGDDIECDVVTLLQGKIVPGGVKSGTVFEAREFLHMPGFLEELLSMTAFSAKTFELTLPGDYPEPRVAGEKATFFVEAHRVYQVDPVELEDLAGLRAAGLGDSLEEAMQSVADEIDAEQGQELLVEATESVLDALAQRVEAEVPAAAINDELRQTWQRSDGAVLIAKRFSQDLIDQAERDFLGSADLRAQAERRIRVGLALGALVEDRGLAPSRESMDMLLETAAQEVGTSAAQAKASIASVPAFALQAGQTALYFTAIEYVMSRAVVDVLEPL